MDNKFNFPVRFASYKASLSVPSSNLQYVHIQPMIDVSECCLERTVQDRFRICNADATHEEGLYTSTTWTGVERTTKS